MTEIHIAKFQKEDWPQVWQILKPVFRAGETYAFDRNISEADAKETWTVEPPEVFVAKEGNAILGTFYIRPNPEPNTCNCGYVVGEAARGKGVAAQMCEFSQIEAARLGYLAMKFNKVVSTNTSAVKLWLRLGFEIIGTNPVMFQHPHLGAVPAHVMYKTLALTNGSGPG